MSNTVTGQTYAQIIDRVASASQNDFEESGVDQQTLQEMKELWQKKLSGLHVAQMPWDPAPPPPQISNPPTVPSNDAKPMQQQQMPVTTAPPNQNYGPVRGVKPEPGYAPPPMAYPAMNGYAALPQDRARHLIAERFGEHGQAAIQYGQHGQQSNVGLPGQQRPMNLQMPPNRQQQQQQQVQQQRAHAQQHPSSIHASQTDGAGDTAYDDWKALVAARRAQVDHGPDGRLAVDGMFRAAMEANANVIESGLMVPIAEVPTSKQGKKARRLRAQLSASGRPSSQATAEPGAPRIPQLDGDLDDDEPEKEIDDEAINSDLDDSEDELPEKDDEDGPQGDTMICTYDKVQRVKNKWKCTLKDGVLSTGGKDYLFHKATGEFEW